MITFTFLCVHLFSIIDLQTSGKDGDWVTKYLRVIISGCVFGLLAIIVPSIWMYCLCCRKKARMTLEERDQLQKDKWQTMNSANRF